MRLIDADELIRQLNDGIEFKADINDVILRQPIAYDVDKVCEELESAVHPYELYDAQGCDIDEVCLIADIVESIVKRGGVDIPKEK